jgi:hypothetical protein
MKISTNDLVSALEAATGFCTFTTKTEPRFKGGKKNPFTGRVFNITERCGMLGVSYENAVRNQRAREGHADASNFHAESLWNGAGRRINRNIVENAKSGKLYAVMYPVRADGMPVNRSTAWFLDGKPATASEVKEILQNLYQSPPVAKQETEETVAWRTFNLDNVLSVHCGGNSFEVSNS